MIYLYTLFLLLLGTMSTKSSSNEWIVPDHTKAFLCGELSATASRLGIFVVQEGEKKPYKVRFFERPSTSEVADINNFIQDTLDQAKDHGINITEACFSAAGFPWERTLMSTHTKVKINADDIAIKYNFQRVDVLNDFELAAYAIDLLPQEKIRILYDGGDKKEAQQQHAPRIIMGASTGLGLCVMYWDKTAQAYKTVGPAWGGGIEFSPYSIEELELQQHILNSMNIAGLQKKATRWGGMLSSCHPSAGLRQIYQFYKNKAEGVTQCTLDVPTREYIVEYQKTDNCCAQAIEKYLELYARCVRNFASATLPFGGIYIAGEFAALYSELFTEDFVRKAFFDLDNLAQMNGLERFPVYIIMEKDLTLLGAANYLAITSES